METTRQEDPVKNNMIYLIGIAGATSSGKTTICEHINQRYGYTHIKLDDFFLDEKDLPFHLQWKNMEIPESLDFDYLSKVLIGIKSGERTVMPKYSKKEYRKVDFQEVIPTKINFIEGFLLFARQDIRDLLDLKIFIKVEPNIVRERRLTRQPDVKEYYLDKIIIPAYKVYGANAERYADNVIDGNRSIEEIEEDFLKIVREHF